MPQSRPNIVLICVDQWRGDCLSSAGHPVVHTPYLDQLAARGARFQAAYSACPSCIAARAGLFTGLTPASHGRVGYCDGVTWNYPITLAGEFTRGGYQTQAVGKMHVHPARNRVGFENVVLNDGFLHFSRRPGRDLALVDDYLPWLRLRYGSEADCFDHGINCNSYVARPWDKPEELHPTNYVVSESLNFLRRRDPMQPFFLFMSFHRPHPPYDPPAWALEQYLNAPMPPVPIGDWAGIFEPFREDDSPDASVARVPERVLNRARAGYYGHMTHIDHQINRFLEALVDQEPPQETLVMFTSDHGELMGDHNLWRKTLPYEGSARVPLLVRGPGVNPGLVHDLPVELCDIMPTLLDLAGLPIPLSVEGRSFAPTLRGQPQPDFRPYIHGEHTCFDGSAQYVTDGKEKYCWLSWSGAEQLFNLRQDPQELHDLSKTQPQRLAYWRDALIRELASRPEGFVHEGRLVCGRAVSPMLGQ